MTTNEEPEENNLIQTIDLIDSTLRSELTNITLNQLNFFNSFNISYKDFVQSHGYHGNQEKFWESVIIDYENYMEKLSKNPNFSIPMSLEMEFIWRVHILHPHYYINDCIQHFGKIINHQCSISNNKYIQHNSVNFRKAVFKTQDIKSNLFINDKLKMFDAIKRQCIFIRKIININTKSPMLSDTLILIMIWTDFINMYTFFVYIT